MKTLRLALVGLLIATTTVFTVSARAADSSISLTCVTFSWPDTIYRPLEGGNVRPNFTFKNGCGIDLLSANYKVVDKYGTSVASGGIVYFKAGVTSVSGETWMDFNLSKGTEPFTMQFSVEYFSTDGISNPAPVTIPFKFAERTVVAPTPSPKPSVGAVVTPTPSPAATIYVTNPTDQTLTDLVSSLKGQVNLLNAKIKRICSAKPKPKGC
jgi:hypothetical protein